MNKPESLTMPGEDSALRARLEGSIGRATSTLLGLQRPDGHWVFELEADATIPAEYVLLRHYLAEPQDAALEGKIAAYLRRIQGAHGGWPLFYAGDFDMSASVKAYFALKMIGDDVNADHMRRARDAIRGTSSQLPWSAAVTVHHAIRWSAQFDACPGWICRKVASHVAAARSRSPTVAEAHTIMHAASILSPNSSRSPSSSRRRAVLDIRA